MIRSLLTIVFVLAICSCGEKTEEREVVEGYKGAARVNPYLAAQKFLEKLGYETLDQQGSVKVDEEQSTVILPASAIKVAADGEFLLDWASWGGHAVILVERGEDYWRDVGEYYDHNPVWWWNPSSEESYEHSAGLDYIAEEICVDLYYEDIDYTETSIDSFLAANGINEDDPSYDKSLSLIKKGQLLPYVDDVVVDTSERKLDIRLGGSYSFQPQYEWEEGEFGGKVGEEVGGQDYRLVSMNYGDGRVTLISDARAFRNPYVTMKDHAELLSHLVALSPREGQVVFNHGEIDGFFHLLMQHYSVALWALLVLVLVWVWKHLPRFGPRQDIVLEDERDQLAHLISTGNYLWSKDCSEELLAPLRAEVISKVHPMANRLEAKHYQSLSQNSGVSESELREAMEAEEIKDTSTMVRAVRHLQETLKSI